MKKLKSLSIGFVLLLSFGFSSFAQAAGGFKDVTSNNGFKNDIEHLVNLGAISGYPDGTFKPNGNVTRGQAAKIITIALDMPLLNPAKPTFKDIPRHHDFYQHIETLYANDIIKGYPDGTFGGAKPVIRSHMAKIVSNSLELTETSNVSFKDVPMTSEFYPYINKMATAGITTGRPDGTYGMTSNVNRGQMAAFVSRGVHHVESETNPTPQPDPDPDIDMDAYWYGLVHFGMTKNQVKAADGTPFKETATTLVYEDFDMDFTTGEMTYSFTNNRLSELSLDLDIRNVLYDEAEDFFKSLVEDVYEPEFFEPASIVSEWEPGNPYLTSSWAIEDHDNLIVTLQLSKANGENELTLNFRIYEFE